MPGKIKPITIKPLTGLMDTRSPVDELAKGEWRYLLNTGVTGRNKLCRIPGWDKYKTNSEYNNEDLHDQLLSITGRPERKPITMLFEAESTRKLKKIIAGTERVLFAQNPSTGNWKVVSDDLGAAGARWRAPAQEGDVVIFTNNVDKPVYWNFDQDVNSGDDQSVAVIPDLETLEISKVGFVIAWKGCVFLMNVVQEGTVRTYRIFWSDFQNPLSYIPGEGSIAGSADVDTNDTILKAEPLRDRLLVYCASGAIWEIITGGVFDGPAFTLAQRYNPKKHKDAALHYPNTLVSLGDEHFFAGVDGFYAYNLFTEKPKLIPWMHKASSLMFDNVNEEVCDVHNAAYNSKRKELLISYAKGSATVPNETLVFNTEFQHSYVLDHGFTAMLMNTPRQEVKSIRDWFLEQCVCASAAELDETFDGFTKEGGYCTDQDEIACTPPTSIFTTVGLEVTDGLETEDYTQGSASAGSLCEQLEGLTMQDLCEAELRADECNAALRFVVASSTDYCLKEFSQNYYREECTGFTGCGTYSRKGYRSLGRTSALNFGDTVNEKEIHRLEMEVHPIDQVVPSKMGIRIGVSAQARDPNEHTCGIVWISEDSKEIECLSDATQAEHLAENTRPDETLEWPLYYIGKNLYVEWEITNPDVTPVDTGGATCISRVTMDIRGVAHNYV